MADSLLRQRIVRFAAPRLLGFLVAILAALTAPGETIRVTSLNLAGSTNTNDSIEILRRLDPDVILLQGVRDWKLCNDVAESLKPARYLVLICSAFASEDAALKQVAVLAKTRGYFSWAQPWASPSAKSEGGFAFAALDIKGRKLGFFSALLDQSPANGELDALLEQGRTAANWEANRVESMAIAIGTGPSSKAASAGLAATILGPAGYADAFGAIPARGGDSAAGAPFADRFLVQSSLFPGNPTLSQTVSSPHPALTCDLELDRARVAAEWTTRAQELERLAAQNLRQQQEAERLASSASKMNLQTRAGEEIWKTWLPAAAGLAVVVIALLVWTIFWSRKRAATKSTALLPAHLAGTLNYTVVVDSPPGTAALRPQGDQVDSGHWQQRALAAEARASQANYVLRSNLSERLLHWLKHRFITRLLTDRDRMLSTQQDAAFRALKVDQRLARVEEQIQKQTEAYQRKIDELTRELQAAREENRELIRARIAQVKLEMEAVRARMLASARES